MDETYTDLRPLLFSNLRSARVRREQYVGEWLPEPLVTDDGVRQVNESDSLSMAFLLLLERLTPVERAVFLLHDVFDYGYDEVAEIVGKSEANCRQFAVRARQHVDRRTGSSRCSPRTSWCTATGAAWHPRGRDRSMGASASAAC